MRTILAATDFSQSAYNACAYALELAKALKARLVIYTAYREMAIILPEMPLLATPEDMYTYATEQLEQTVKQLGSQQDVPVETFCSENDSAQGIIEAAEKMDASIIVLGMKEERKGLRRVFGSTATALMHRTSVPVLTIPQHVKYR